MSNEQKQKLKDYRKEYYKKYYAEKKLNNYYHGQVYYLIKHVTTKSSAKHVDRLLSLLRNCFSCLIK